MGGGWSNTSHQELFVILLLLLLFIPLLFFIEGRHSRGGAVREDAPGAAVPHSDLVEHAALVVLVVVLLLILARRLGGGVARVEPAAPGPSPPLGLVVDADLVALASQRSGLLLVLILFLLLFL